MGKGTSMATDLEQSKAATTNYETYLDEKLTHTRKRIRLLDVAVACLGLVIAALLYGLIVALFDRAFSLPAGFRQVAFGGFFLSALGYLSFTVIIPLYRQINPYFAARALENTLPE